MDYDSASSSSTKSFAWAPASNSSDSENSDSAMSVQNKKGTIKDEFNTDTSKNSNGYSFHEQNTTKIKHDSESSIDSPKQKRLKVKENEDTYINKKKRKKQDKYNISDNLEENILNDYDFLNKKVKQEEDDSHKPKVLKSKKSRKFSDNDLNISSNELDSAVNYNKKKEKKTKNKNKHKDLETDTVMSDEQKFDESPKKRKTKTKVDVKSDESNDGHFKIENKFCAEETVVQKSYSPTPTYYEVNNSEDTDRKSDSVLHKHFSNNQSNHNNLDIRHEEYTNNRVLETKANRKSLSDHSSNNTTLINKKRQSTPKILDRIRFEDETDTDGDVTENNIDKESSRLKKFVKEKSSLEVLERVPVLEKLRKFQEITDDDEIWIVKCPHNIDILGFNNKELTLDSKSKIKISGETYNGTLDENIVSATLMTSDKRGFLIKNVKINGTVTLRKRLPKPHIVEDNVMVNNQTDFIPLPETKCRHPLFGANYKNALKMPISITQRLEKANQSVTSQIEKKKRKKHKKEHSIDEDVDISTEIKREIEGEVSPKKAKKRKHDNDHEITVKKAKRLKQELDSSDVWESEKAIEENLFNF